MDEKVDLTIPEPLIVYESTTDDMPTVLWFTLCNREFKNDPDYQKYISPTSQASKKSY